MMILACNLSNHQFNLFSPEPLDMSLEEIVCLKVRTFVEEEKTKLSNLDCRGQQLPDIKVFSLYKSQPSSGQLDIRHMKTKQNIIEFSGR